MNWFLLHIKLWNLLIFSMVNPMSLGGEKKKGKPLRLLSTLIEVFMLKSNHHEGRVGKEHSPAMLFFPASCKDPLPARLEKTLWGTALQHCTALLLTQTHLCTGSCPHWERCMLPAGFQEHLNCHFKDEKNSWAFTTTSWGQHENTLPSTAEKVMLVFQILLAIYIS